MFSCELSCIKTSAKSYIHPLCVDTECCLENLPRAMDNRAKWQESESQRNPCCSYVMMMMIKLWYNKSKKLTTIVEGDPKAPFSVTTTLMCKRGLICLVGRVFANGLRDQGSVPSQVIPKTLKMVLDTSLLNT